MIQINFSCPRHIHFIGIGGISMSGLAAVLLDRGFAVSGSDAKKSSLTEWLESLGATVAVPQSAANITDDIACVVYTAAIHPDNPEYQEVCRRGIPMLSRAELLGQLADNYPISVAVAGTHGKTTTTSMLSHILMAADCDPTISVGGILPAIGGNVRVGNSDYFLTEACEYTNSFLTLSPSLGLILNIDADHLDFFKDLDDIRNSFRLFAQKIPAGGSLVVHAKTEKLCELFGDLPCKVVTFGTGIGKYHAEDVSYENGCGSFALYKEETLLGRFSLQVPGAHNVDNAAAAIACGDLLGLSPAAMAKGLLAFTGTERRFQKKGEIAGVAVVDDYAHHPTEIRATLLAANQAKGAGTLWCVFQPHTYTRTKALFDDFADALLLADRVILADIYAARETDNLGVSSTLLAEEIKKKGGNAVFFATFDEIETFLLSSCVPGDLVLTMGAGDVVRIGERLLGQV